MKLTIKPFTQPKKTIILVVGLLFLSSSISIASSKIPKDFGDNIMHSFLAQEVTAPHYQFKVGQQYQYSINYKSHAKSDLSVLFTNLDRNSRPSQNSPNSLKNDFDIKVHSNVLMTVLAKQKENYLIAYNFINPTVSISSEGQYVTEQSKLISKDLNREIVAVVDPNGHIKSVQFAPGIADISQVFARTIISNTQFITPDKNTKIKEWTEQEEDQNGTFVARYTSSSMLENNNTNPSFHKKKIKYLPRPSKSQSNHNSGESDIIIQPQGELVGKFNTANGYLQELNGNETKKTIISNKEIGTDDTELHLKFQSMKNLSLMELQNIQSRIRPQLTSVAKVLSYQISDEELEAKTQKQELGSTTLESILADLDKASESNNSTQNYTPLYLKIKALIYLKPEASKIFGDRLAIAKPGSLSLQLLGSALSAAGHADAQTALLKAIMSKSNDTKVVISLLPNLAAIENPTSQTITTLQGFIETAKDDEVKTMSQLVLGAFANKLSPEKAQPIIDRFAKALQITNSPDEQRRFLLALGNVGKAEVLPVVEPFIQSSNPVLRAAATTALRKLPNVSVDETLVRLLTQDSDDNVRLETASILGLRKMTAAAYTAQKESFIKDKSVKVRLTILDNLWKVRQDYPEVIQIVKNAAEKDVEKDIKEAAIKLLAAT
jgi:HEAT repeat protein